MKQRLEQLLSQREHRRIVDTSRVLSAVLVPLYYKQGQYYVLLIQRTEKVKNHKGQIAFPGGAFEERDETLLDTALRESTEEIGLKPEDVEVLGEMDDEISITSYYIISPFVALIPWPYQFKVDGEETEAIIEVPIQALLDKGSVRQGTDIVEGKPVTSYFYHYQEKVIWGATARILNQFLYFFTQAIDGKD